MAPVWLCNYITWEEREPDDLLFFFSLFCYECTIRHRSFTLSLGVIGRLCSVIQKLPGHLRYYSITFSDCLGLIIGFVNLMNDERKTNESEHSISYKITCPPSVDSDQPP